MARIGESPFRATDHDTEQRDFEGLPDGIYVFETIESKLDDTKDGKGKILKMTLSALEPEAFKGRRHWLNINIQNGNPQAQEIGQKELAALCRAVGVLEIKDSEELHFKAFTAKVAMGKPSKDLNADKTPKYPSRPEIKRYFFPDEGDLPAADVVGSASNDNAGARAAPASTAATSTTSSGAPKANRPWGKKT